MATIERERILEPGDYHAGFPCEEAELVVTGTGRFHATLDRVVLDKLEIALGAETKARVAYVSLRTEGSVVSFPADEASTLIICGEPVHFGQLAWHDPGGRFHERISPFTRWGRIHLVSAGMSAMDSGAAGVLRPAAPPPRIIIPDPAQSRNFLAAFNAAITFGESMGGGLPRPAHAHLIEAALMDSLTRCLTYSRVFLSTTAKRHHHEIMLRFEGLLPTWSEQPIYMRDLCTALGISERTLRTCFEEQVGVGPHRYMRMHRLSLVRRALLRSSPTTASVASVARRYGFPELGRFAALYRVAFGELPSCTLAQARRVSVACTVDAGAPEQPGA